MTLSSNERSALLLLSSLMPGSFDKDTLKRLLGLPPSAGEALLRNLVGFKLMQMDPSGGSYCFKVTPLVREASM